MDIEDFFDVLTDEIYELLLFYKDILNVEDELEEIYF
jgi:hypothetical protein